MRIFKNEFDLEKFDITKTKDLIDGYEFNELKDDYHKYVLQGMQFMYEAAINAVINAGDNVELSLSSNKVFEEIASNVIDDFTPELLRFLAGDMAETLISFLDDEVCREIGENNELETKA